MIIKHTYVLLYLFLIAAASLCAIIFFAPNTRALDADDLAIQTSCDIGDATSFTALTTYDAGAYDVYVRLAKRGQSATVNVNVEAQTGNASCVSVGEVLASGDQWTKAGQWNNQESDTATVFQVVSKQLGLEIDANRPSVMLIPQGSDICVPAVQCAVTVEGKLGYILPPGTLPNIDSLRVVRVVNPSEDSIKKVVYYVDEQPMYTTASLQEFDLRYVALPGQKLSSVIEYESGQRVVIDEQAPESHADNFGNFVFRIVQTNPRLLQSFAWIGGGLLLLLTGWWIIGAYRRRRQWRLNHGLEREQIGPMTDADRLRAFRRDHITTIARRVIQVAMVVVGVLIAMYMTTMYIVSTFRVDGQSMESTYQDTSQVLINKIPITAGQISGKDYVPARGEVVILRAVYGIVDTDNVYNQDSYVIKRVIGLPGERVVVKDGKITIYNKNSPEGFDPDEGSSWQATMVKNDPGESIDVTLGQNELFISGDNRPGSIDSRFNGPILTKQIIGIVSATLFSP